MNIIFDKDDAVDSRYIVLELDTIMIPGRDKPLTAYCALENIPITEMADLDQYRNLHANLIKNYRLKNWKFCEDALEHLVGRWNKEIDTFYFDISTRIKQYKEQDPGPGWSGVIINGENK